MAKHCGDGAAIDAVMRARGPMNGGGDGLDIARRDCHVTILASFPGVGRIVLATLLAEALDPLQRREYHALRCLFGVAPVTRRSGKSKIVIRRLTAHRRLCDAVRLIAPREYSLKGPRDFP